MEVYSWQSQHIRSRDERHHVVYGHGPQVVFSTGLSRFEIAARFEWAVVAAVPWVNKDSSDITSSPQWVAIKDRSAELYPRLEADSEAAA